MKQLLTRWGKNLDENYILPEYPRPQLRRESFFNLNGAWDYAISKNAEIKNYEGKILVPFSPEAVLSGVNQFVSPDEYLHYRKLVILPKDFMKDRLILHFGAVDQIAEIWINETYVGKHIGGFTPFSFDITDCVMNQSFEIRVRVKDFSDTSYHQTGKQRIDRGGIWYTPQSGLWQTVWLESVPHNYMKGLKSTPLFDEKSIRFDIDKTGDEEVQIKVYFQGQEQGSIASSDDIIIVPLKELYPWTPETPNLYDIEIYYGEDVVKSYVGMRLFESKKDKNGVYRFYLNHEPYFLSGVLDQGYYPDGLLTPPSDEAMINDIEVMKQMGFNMLRKHIKIEPLRWYYHCDKQGVIVWQDMINGSERKDIIFHGALAMMGIHINDKHYKLFGRGNENGRKQYKIELQEMINHLYSVTSIATWVPFNEAWGQFDSKEILELVKSLDDTRLIDAASGWSDQKIGDYHSRHIYFTKIKFKRKTSQKRINALTEFGGYSLPIEKHRYNEDDIFGYKKFESIEALEEAIEELYLNQVYKQLDNGLSALIYTQLSDVEDEINGFITYDRDVVKINKEKVLELNERLYRRFKEIVNT